MVIPLKHTTEHKLLLEVARSVRAGVRRRQKHYPELVKVRPGLMSETGRQPELKLQLPVYFDWQLSEPEPPGEQQRAIQQLQAANELFAGWLGLPPPPPPPAPVRYRVSSYYTMLTLTLSWPVLSCHNYRKLDITKPGADLQKTALEWAVRELDNFHNRRPGTMYWVPGGGAYRRIARPG